MAKRHVSTALAIYLLAFGVALRIFLSGYHVTAFLILVAVWAAVAAWLWRVNGRL